MDLNINEELAALRRLTVRQLQARYAELFGDSTNNRNRVWLIRRILWRLQALAEGDLSDRARKRAEELANDADLRITLPRISKPRPALTEVIAAPRLRARRSHSAPRHVHHPQVQGPDLTGGSVARRVFVCRKDLYLPVRRGQGHYGQPLQWVSLLQMCRR